MLDPIGVQSWRRQWLCLMLVVAGIAVAPGVAAATSIYIDEFDVTRSAAPLFDDSFNRSMTLSGGAGKTLPSGVNFAGAGGGPASYFVHGTVPERTANNGQALVSASNGVLISQPHPVRLSQWAGFAVRLTQLYQQHLDRDQRDRAHGGGACRSAI